MPEYTDLSCNSPATAEAVKAYLDEQVGQVAQDEGHPNIAAYVHKSTLRLTYGDEVDRQDWDMQLLGFRDGYEKGRNETEVQP